MTCFCAIFSMNFCVCYFMCTFPTLSKWCCFFIYMQNMHPGEYCLRKAGVLVEPAWLWYSFPEVGIRKETEIGLRSTKQTRISVICDEEEAFQLVKYVRKLDVESISHMIGDHQTFHTQTSTAAYISAQQWWWWLVMMMMMNKRVHGNSLFKWKIWHYMQS